MTTDRKPVALSWSGGKDGAMALHTLRESADYAVELLLTTVDETTGLVPMHGIGGELLNGQAEQVGCPIEIVELPPMPSNEVYEERMSEVFDELKADGVDTVAFGDLFLEDVRDFRKKQVEEAGMRAVFPLWGTDTEALSRRFVDEGWRAVITCVDTERLDAEFAARAYDGRLLDDLPDGVDPCAENGEFHTFVWDGPEFLSPLEVSVERRVREDQRWMYARLAIA